MIIDTVASIMIVMAQASLQFIFLHEQRSGDDSATLVQISVLSLLVLSVPFSLILAASAYYLVKTVTKISGRRENRCVLILHITNMFLMIFMLLIAAVFFRMG